MRETIEHKKDILKTNILSLQPYPHDIIIKSCKNKLFPIRDF